MRQGNESGQMMVLETIFFASTILLSIVFLHQLSPSSVVSDEYTSDLKALGDDALRNMYNDNISNPHDLAYPSNKLIHYIIQNEYGSFISDIKKLLPSNALYNVYITNGETTVFWCNSFGNHETQDILTSVDPVVISHCLIPLDHQLLADTGADIYNDFIDYSDCVYEVRLQMWYI